MDNIKSYDESIKETLNCNKIRDAYNDEDVKNFWIQ